MTGDAPHDAGPVKDRPVKDGPVTAPAAVRRAVSRALSAIPVALLLSVMVLPGTLLSVTVLAPARAEPGNIAPAPPPVDSPAGTTTDLLTFIRALEAPRGYDDYERRIPLPPPVPLTRMRLGAVLDWQRSVRAAGAPSTAAGGYQIIWPTLSRLVRIHGLDRAAVFDAALQDRLARLLIDECDSRPAPSDRAAHPRFGNCLAGIWASLPLTAGPRRGRSAHDGTGGNRALTTPETVLALLAGEPVALRRMPQIRRGIQGRPVAFDAIPLRDINDAMQSVSGSLRLTPFAWTWAAEPHADD